MSSGLIFHLAGRDEWEAAAGGYRPASLDLEGFIHCSTGGQLHRTADRHFPGRDDLLLVEIDPEAVADRLRYEPDGGGESFPHIHGPIPPEAVVRVTPWSQGPVEGATIDIGGVIQVPSVEPVARALARAGTELDPGLLLQAHHHGMAEYDSQIVEEAAWAGYANAFCSRLGVPAARLPIAVAAFFEEMRRPGTWATLIEGAEAGLRLVAATGLPLAVVSNSDGTVARRLLEAGVLQVGEGPGVPVVAIIDSGQVGIEKPDQRIFDLAVAALGVPRSRVVHVGDSRRMDVAGAEGAAIRPLHLDPFRLCPDPGHAHVRSLAEVAALVRSR